MNAATWDETNGRIESKSGPPEPASRQYERLQARAGGHSETALGRALPPSTRRTSGSRFYLIADKGGINRYRRATRILAEVIASDASWLMVFNGAIDHIIQNNPKARQNPRGLSQLDG
jgi:hypothetical protein